MGKLWRNRELRRCLLLAALLGAVLLPLCFLASPAAGWAAAGLYLATGVLFLHYTLARYRQLDRLSGQLAHIAGGRHRLEVGEYVEGELGVLASELVKITSALAHQARSLERDKSFLADSLADISHQLKTPLTSMSMLADLLETPDLPPEKRREFLDGLRVSLDRMQWLISSLLKLSRLDAGAVVFQPEPLDLAELVRDAARPLQVLLERKHLALEIRGQASALGDRHWLGEAVGNLLKNCAEQSGERGLIQVDCAENPLYREIRIRDDGPGIPSGDLPHIFRRFYRGKNAAPDSVGIGLALCKSILHNQGGVITAANRPEGGAEFVIKLYGSAGPPPGGE